MKRANRSSNKDKRRRFRKAGRPAPHFLPKEPIVMPDDDDTDPPIPDDEEPTAQDDAPPVPQARVRKHRRRAAQGTMRDARGRVVDLR